MVRVERPDIRYVPDRHDAGVHVERCLLFNPHEQTAEHVEAALPAMAWCPGTVLKTRPRSAPTTEEPFPPSRWTRDDAMHSSCALVRPCASKAQVAGRALVRVERPISETAERVPRLLKRVLDFRIESIFSVRFSTSLLLFVSNLIRALRLTCVLHS